MNSKNYTEENFLRAKTQTLYTTTNTVIDKATGEILRSEELVKTKTAAEPDFIKVYYRTMLAVNGIEGLSLDFVLALASVISYTNDATEPILFHNNRATRNKLAELCAKKSGEPISDNMVSRHIKTAKDVGLLFSTEYKGTYEVNPWLIAKGKWANISKLQAGFSFDGTTGRWFRSAELKQNSQEQEQEQKPTGTEG